MSLRMDEKTLRKLQQSHSDLTEVDTKAKLARLAKLERKIPKLEKRIRTLEKQVGEVFAVKRWMEIQGGYRDGDVSDK